MCTESDLQRDRRSATDSSEAFQRLQSILHTLRSQCPWDRQQTLKSLRYLTIEEVHELSEAIVEIENAKSETAPANPSTPAALSSDLHHSPLTTNLKKELGDLAMHILFYCMIAEEQGLFTTADVYNAISDKLIDRHPFIYHQADYHGESWEQLKMREGRKNVLEGVPRTLPSLIKAVRIQEKVNGMHPAENKRLNAEGETQSSTEGEISPHNDSRLSPLTSHLPTSLTEEEFGDLIFALVGWGLQHGLNADDALSGANLRFCQAHSAVLS